MIKAPSMTGQEVTDEILDSIREQFEAIDETYVFNYDWAKISRREHRVDPAGMPILWEAILKEKRILEEDELLQRLKDSPDLFVSPIPGHSKEDTLRFRVRQVWTGHLREVDFVLRLKKADPLGKIFKDADKDTGQGGVDIQYLRSWDQKVFFFAIMMRPTRNDWHSRSQRQRKEAKRAAYVIPILITPDGPGLAKATNEDIEAYANDID